MNIDFTGLQSNIEGEIRYNNGILIDYSTDSSIYREKPLAVIYPKCEEDIKKIILFANENHLTIIPRGGGTSLAGQVVGSGIVVDISRYLNSIKEINVKHHYAVVQPGVVRDTLNNRLKPNGLMFAPETSTSNRCTIAGMTGNNSCGANSLIYGSVRDHLLCVKGFLSDGSFVVFESLNDSEFKQKMLLQGLEGDIYRGVYGLLNNKENRKKIEESFPDKRLRRRNNGYAFDMLTDCKPFNEDGDDFNFCRLIAGSEGTLMFITEIKINLVPLPAVESALLCIHLDSIEQALKANIEVLKTNPFAVELMDGEILKLASKNGLQKENSFFIDGNPEALLIAEYRADSEKQVVEMCNDAICKLQSLGYGYSFPIVKGDVTAKVWALRKAGLGVLSNMDGGAKPVAVIEDTAVIPEYLPEYISEIHKMLDDNGLSCIYYAHAGTGELHLRPVLDLKKKHDIELFRIVAYETAKLVKKYKGSLSGEHGDGRLRGEFIAFMLGEQVYKMALNLKYLFDPINVFNKGKITDSPVMNSFTRFENGLYERKIETLMDFGKEGILGSTERCNGSADCRKTKDFKGLMCPSFMATEDEMNTPRARANLLRDFLTFSNKPNPFDNDEIYKVMDSCLSCKGCKKECPSNVDIAKLKAEFLFNYYKSNKIPLRSRLIAYMPQLYSTFSPIKNIANFFLSNKVFSYLIKRFSGFATGRNIPLINPVSVSVSKNIQIKSKGTVYLFLDEFTRYNDGNVGNSAIIFLEKLGYNVIIAPIEISGRTFISKGFLGKAKKIAEKNISLLSKIIGSETPLIGLEPSAILSFRDEYPDLVGSEFKNEAVRISEYAFLFEEFFMREMDAGNLSAEMFSDENLEIYLHGHCQQKAITSIEPLKNMLLVPKNYSVKIIESCCCGMAGSFGYEKEHYDLSMEIGEMFLFPEVRNAPDNAIIAAAGTSCRHQIFDGTGRMAFHPIEILLKALE